MALSALVQDSALVRLGPGGDYVTELRPTTDGRLERSSPSDHDSDRGSSEGWGFSLLKRRTPPKAEAAREADGYAPPLAAASRVDQVHVSALALKAGTLVALERAIQQQAPALAEVAQACAAMAAAFSAHLAAPFERARAASRVVTRPLAARALVDRDLAAASFTPSSPRFSTTPPGFNSQSRPLEVVDDEPHAQTAQDPSAHPRLPSAAWLFADDAGARRSDRRQQGHRVRARRGADQERRAHARSEQSSLFVDR